MSPTRHIRRGKNFELGSELLVGHKVELITGDHIPSDGSRRRDTDDVAVNSYTLGAAGALVSEDGLGVQLGASFTNLRMDDAADLNIRQLDGHIYGDMGSTKIGIFASHLDLGDLDIQGIGSTDLDASATAYGAEGQFSQNALTFEAYAGLGDVENADADMTLYGIGASYDLTPTFGIRAAYDGATIGVDAVEDDLHFHNVSVGAEYYPAEAPIRLSASVGRITTEFAGYDDSATSFGLGASYLLDGRPDSSRENLFRAVSLPF